MSQREISDGINKYFWFDKVSKAGNLDKIRERIVYPPMEDDVKEIETIVLVCKFGRKTNRTDKFRVEQILKKC